MAMSDRGSKSSELDLLKEASQDFARTVGDRAMSKVSDGVSGLTDRLTDMASSPSGKALAKGAKAKAEGGSGLMGGVKGAVSGVKDKVVDTVTGGGGGKSKGGDATSSTNIIESIDVGVPVSVAYNQWTEFGAFPSFMKKVENVEAEDDEKLKFKAQIFLSHRSWEATVLEQVPDERIVWRSKGEKGHVDGAVTFHELAPNLTRILVVLEYYPQGLFEKTGNLWRAQGRRAKAELKHFRRHVMTRTALDPDSVEGWRGVIHDGEVVESHEEHVEREEEEREAEGDDYEDQADEDQADEDQADDEPADEDEADDETDDEEAEYDDADEAEEYEEPEPEDEEPEDEEPEDETDEEPEDEADEEPEDEYEEEPEDEFADDEADDQADEDVDEDVDEDIDEDVDDEAEPEDEDVDEEAEPEEYDEDEAEEEPSGRRSRRRRAS